MSENLILELWNGQLTLQLCWSFRVRKEPRGFKRFQEQNKLPAHSPSKFAEAVEVKRDFSGSHSSENSFILAFLQTVEQFWWEVCKLNLRVGVILCKGCVMLSLIRWRWILSVLNNTWQQGLYKNQQQYLKAMAWHLEPCSGILHTRLSQHARKAAV